MHVNAFRTSDPASRKVVPQQLSPHCSPAQVPWFSVPLSPGTGSPWTAGYMVALGDAWLQKEQTPPVKMITSVSLDLDPFFLIPPFTQVVPWGL